MISWIDSSFNRSAELKKAWQPIKVKHKFHLLPQAANPFEIDNLTIKCTSRETEWAQFIFNHPIRYNETSSFKLKVLQIKNKGILIGIVDYNQQKDHQSSFNTGYALGYTSQGKKWPGNVAERDGFKQGDVVEVKVNRAKKTVHYFVNGNLKANQTNYNLGH